MRSRFENIKTEVIIYRKRGASLGDIQKKYGVPKSTLNYWFKDIILSLVYKRHLQKRHAQALVKARKEAVKWHNAQKEQRLITAKREALASLSSIKTSQQEVIELALAFLYLGEGLKGDGGTSLGNSNPQILIFFIESLKQVYGLKNTDFKCELHLRADQNERTLKKYWSDILHIPLTHFLSTSFDKRTAGRATYAHYKGVCIVRCGRVAIQRKLMYIATQFSENVVKG